MIDNPKTYQSFGPTQQPNPIHAWMNPIHFSLLTITTTNNISVCLQYLGEFWQHYVLHHIKDRIFDTNYYVLHTQIWCKFVPLCMQELWCFI